MPHLWVMRGQTRLAIHDLLEPEGLLLLTQPAGRTIWQDAADAVRQRFGMRLTCLSIRSGHRCRSGR